MSGSVFILAINLSVALLFSGAFLLISLLEKSRVSARWFAFAYCGGFANILAEFLIPMVSPYEPLVTAGYAAFLAGLALFCVGLARMYAVRVPWGLIGAVFLAGTLLQAVSQETMVRESLLRMSFYQGPFAAMQAIAAAIVFAGAAKRRLDYGLGVLLGLSTLHFLAKPYLAALTGGMGDSPQSYLGTTYALFSQSTGTVFAMSIALTVLGVQLKRLMDEMTERSRTDALSGLLNRRGFDERLDAMLGRHGAAMPTVSLVLCDLDHFKSVNDTLGHAAGDRVITEFAAILMEATTSAQAVGRIGGEEFVVALPGADLAVARLFAENVRTAFTMQSLEDFPGTPGRLTASFGVVRFEPGESGSQALRRADQALYLAKTEGRDRVCEAPSANAVSSPARRPAA